MANELLLKMIVNGLHNSSLDNEVLFEHLNLRALFYGRKRLFRPSRYAPPVPPYRSEEVSRLRAAALMTRVADKLALFAVYLGATPATPRGLADETLDEADLLRLIIDWGTVQAAAYKSIIQLYGEDPAPPPPPLPNPGAASSQRLWAEIAALLERIATDSHRVAAVQDLPVTYAPRRGTRSRLAPLVAFEQEVQRAALNTLEVAARLPYHLFHAAHATARARGRRA